MCMCECLLGFVIGCRRLNILRFHACVYEVHRFILCMHVGCTLEHAGFGHVGCDHVVHPYLSLCRGIEGFKQVRLTNELYIYMTLYAISVAVAAICV